MPHLVVFSHLRWNFVYQRPQHLLSRLASRFPVIFVEEPMSSSELTTPQVTKPCPGVSVLRPRTSKASAGFHDDQLAAVRKQVAAYLQSEGIEDYLVWFYTPMALPLLGDLRPRAVIYDCMDELSMFKDAPRQMRQREKVLLRSAHLVLAGGPSLYQAKSALNPNVLCLPSAVDEAHYNPDRSMADGERVAAARALQQHIPHPRLGFFGVIDERLDVELIRDLAAARPDCQLVMVGPVVKIDGATLPQAANIHWLGQQSYEVLPQLAAEWDVCLLPFALNDATRFISPTKTLEYMAARRPIVATPIQDVRQLFGTAVVIAESTDEFIDACTNLLNESRAQRSAREAVMAKCVAEYSWDVSARTVCDAIEVLLAAPLRDNAVRMNRESTAAPVRTAANPPVTSYENVIIGAGPTGLSCAYHVGTVGRGERTLLIERERRVGGWCRSVVDHGFTFDCAGHIMFSNDTYVQSMYETLLGDNVHWQNREAWIYSKRTYTRYPFQGALHGLPPDVLKECLVGALEARFGALSGKGDLQPGGIEAPRNFEEFIHKVWGAGIAKHFAIPYNEKLWATPLSEMETSWLGGRVPLPDIEQMIAGALEPVPQPMGPNARFGYPLRGGFQALMDAFLPKLGCELALDTEVVQLCPSERWLRLSDGRTLRYSNLVSTMGLPQLIAACGTEAPLSVQTAAKALRHVSVRCVNLGIARESITDKHWIYYPEDTIFHRIFVQGNASPYCNSPGGFGITCEISYGPSKPLPADGEELVQRVLLDCKRVGFLREDDELITANQVDMPLAYVVYDHDRARNVAHIREWLDDFGIVLRGRYSEWEYYNSDHAFLAGKRAAEELLKKYQQSPAVAIGSAA